MVDSWARPAAEVVLTILVAITLVSVTLTLMAFRRLDQKLGALRAQRDGQPVPDIDTAWGRLIDRIVPDVVLINTFPRMSQVLEYMTLSGKPRRLVTLDLRLGHRRRCTWNCADCPRSTRPDDYVPVAEARPALSYLCGAAVRAAPHVFASRRAAVTTRRIARSTSAG